MCTVRRKLDLMLEAKSVRIHAVLQAGWLTRQTSPSGAGSRISSVSAPHGDVQFVFSEIRANLQSGQDVDTAPRVAGNRHILVGWFTVSLSRAGHAHFDVKPRPSWLP
jgi:hypothetical protein